MFSSFSAREILYEVFIIMFRISLFRGGQSALIGFDSIVEGQFLASPAQE
jgi:hypothetical protein